MSKPKQTIDAGDIYTEPEIILQIGISKTFNLKDSDKKHRGESFLDKKTLRFGGIRRVSDDVGHQILGINTRKKDVEYEGLAIPFLIFGTQTRLSNLRFGVINRITKKPATAN